MEEVTLSKPKRSQSNPLVIKIVRREVRMLQIGEHELNSIVSWDTSLYGTFLGISFGVLVAVGITIATVTITSQAVYAAFFGTMIASLLATAFLGIKLGISVRATRETLRQIKAELNGES